MTGNKFNGLNKTDEELLVRLDEKVGRMDQQISINSVKLDNIIPTIRQEFLTKAEFNALFVPIQRALYAIIGFFLTSIGGLLITTIIKNGHFL